jgi:hypothetical protein
LIPMLPSDQLAAAEVHARHRTLDEIFVRATLLTP